MKPLFNFRPFLFLSASLAVGILSAKIYFLNGISPFIFITTAFILVCAVCFFLFGFKGNIRLSLITIFAVIFVFLGGYFSTSKIINNFNDANLNSHTYEVSAKVESVIETKNYKTLILSSVKLKGVNGGKTNYKIRAYVYGASEFDIGDSITFTTSVSDKSIIYHDNFSASDLSRGIKYLVELASDEIIVVDNSKTIFEKASEFIKNSLASGLDGNEFATAYALLTGYSHYIDGEVIESYRNAGIAHIFAVSGLHIGILALALGFIFKKLKVNGYVRAIIVTLACLFYSGVCSFSASSLRATIMCGVTMLSRASGRKYDALSSVSLSALIILAINPIQLFCVGFRLSFVVVLGIILLSPVFTKLFRFMPKKLASSLGVVISAQLASVPVCLEVFGQFSTISIIFNLIFVPLITPIFIALLSLCIVGGIFGISLYLLFPLKYIFIAINAVITFLDYDIFLVGGFKMGIFSALYYAGCFALSGIINLKKLPLYILSAILIFSSILGTAITTAHENNAVKVYAIGSSYIQAVLVDSKEKSSLIIVDANLNYPVSQLDAISRVSGVTNVDEIIILNGVDVDVQNLYARIRRSVKTRKIYYYGEDDYLFNAVISACYAGVTASGYLQGQTMGADIEYYSQCGGYALTVKVGDNYVFVGGKIDGANVSLNENFPIYDVVFASSYEQFVFGSVKGDKTVTFTPYGDYADCESQGVKKFYLD